MAYKECGASRLQRITAQRAHSVQGRLIISLPRKRNSTIIVERASAGLPSLTGSTIRLARTTLVAIRPRRDGFSDPRTSRRFLPTRQNRMSCAQSERYDMVCFGCSFMWLYAKILYRHFPQRVKGMVLVDSTPIRPSTSASCTHYKEN